MLYPHVGYGIFLFMVAVEVVWYPTDKMFFTAWNHTGCTNSRRAWKTGKRNAPRYEINKLWISCESSTGVLYWEICFAKIVPLENQHKKINFVADGIEKDYTDVSYFEFKKSRFIQYQFSLNTNLYNLNRDFLNSKYDTSV